MPAIASPIPIHGLAHIAAKKDDILALEDIAWAILNTNEFLFQH